MIEAASYDYKMAVLAALVVAYPRPLAATTIADICGSANKATHVITSLDPWVYLSSKGGRDYYKLTPEYWCSFEKRIS